MADRPCVADRPTTARASPSVVPRAQARREALPLKETCAIVDSEKAEDRLELITAQRDAMRLRIARSSTEPWRS
ncbi:hypothetical protein ACIBBE_28745 [Streptomyces sp. NPDC051644]|uniref:hypothetical protein n=1 Tax=Streptomyces sp. NPDC051644 TaxID=3365666 RepID=UPI00378E0E2C